MVHLKSFIPRVFFATCIAVQLAGCGAEGPAKNALKSTLNDPDSAKFSALSPGKSEGDVCGFFNAKNRMGGYVGDTPFFYEKSLDMATIVAVPEDRDFRNLWSDIRSNDFSESLSKIVSRCHNLQKWETVCSTPTPGSKHPMCEAVLGDGKTMYGKLKAEYDR